jgi:hypothetical protein
MDGSSLITRDRMGKAIHVFLSILLQPSVTADLYNSRPGTGGFVEAGNEHYGFPQ